MGIKPNYWYQQSSVIPFQLNNGKLKVLIITSRKKKRWIFPKGIIEVDLSPEESAKKEALEEAGVKGELLTRLIGEYEYNKWGGKCNVKVYGLKVLTILSEWEEDFRERKWIGIDEVGNYIKQNKVLNIVKIFANETNTTF
jgi:phosphohistidine phosphatase